MPAAGPTAPRFQLPAAQRALLAGEYPNMQACIRCGLCLTSCPTYLLRLVEAEGPRGRIAMARALLEGHLELTPDLVMHQTSCLLCDACTRVCPAGVRMEELGVPLRQVFEELRPRPLWQRAIRSAVFVGIFGSPARFRTLAALLRLYQRSGLRRLVRASGVLSVLGLASTERYLPTIDNQFIVPSGQHWSPPGSTSGKVSLFVGCVMGTAFAETDRSTVRLLTRAGFRVRATPNQACCGALHAHYGDREGARALARKNIEAFEADAGSLVVVNAAGCGAMLKEYGHLLRDDATFAGPAAAFAGRVRDASEALSGRLPPLSLSNECTVTYQEPCHLAHAQGISRQPRELLAAAGVRVVEMAESSVCCGSAGVYNLLQSATADQLRDRKLDHAAATGAPQIVTANPGCLIQLQAGLALRGEQTRVRHLLDLLDERYRQADEQPAQSAAVAANAP